MGKSRQDGPGRKRRWDHPHPCGEKLANQSPIPAKIGSPPPMWGKGFSAFSTCLSSGITPTHVGKSNRTRQKCASCRDHPHPCGEKFQLRNRTRGRKGSPPPMWGKASSHAWIVRRGRITPTHVGKSSYRAIREFQRKDHPHPCGEKGQGRGNSEL